MLLYSESNLAGWELLGTCLVFFAPSVKFFVYLDGYISKQLQPEQTDVSFNDQIEHSRCLSPTAVKFKA